MHQKYTNMHQKTPIRTALATERTQHQAWATRQRDALIEAGVSPIDAQARVDSVLAKLPPGADPATWTQAPSDMVQPLDDALITDASSTFIASDATPGEFTFLLQAREEDAA